MLRLQDANACKSKRTHLVPRRHTVVPHPTSRKLLQVLCAVAGAWGMSRMASGWANVQGTRSGLHVSMTSLDDARPWPSDDEAVVPQWECTQASGLCDCMPAERRSEEAGTPSIAHDVRRTRQPGCPNRRLPERDGMPRRGGPPHAGAIHPGPPHPRATTRHVLVHIDPYDYLRSELPLGRYACPRSTCTVARDPTDDPVMDPDANVYVACSLSARPKTPRYPHQHSVMISLESPVRWPLFNDDACLRQYNFTDLVRPGLWPVPGASPATAPRGSIPVWPITYSNADWRQYLRPPLAVDRKIRGVAVFISNCDPVTATRRLDLLDALSGSGMPVYWFGFFFLHSHGTKALYITFCHLCPPLCGRAGALQGPHANNKIEGARPARAGGARARDLP